MRWASPVTTRDQLVLFSDHLDEVLPDDHPARRLDEFLQVVSWSNWEQRYRQTGPGRPPIHPRVMATVILYGLMKRIRSSRQLEEALQMRLDFRWLAEDRSIDHSTLCNFRREHGEQLKDLFVQIGLVAHKAGLLKLQQLAFDGTRIRANNRRRGGREVAHLKELKEELERKFDEFRERADTLDHEDQASPTVKEEMRDAAERLRQISKAMEEVKRLEDAKAQVPKRIPLTDPESRISPNKEGGFSANYTPLALVAVDSELLVNVDVIAETDEKAELCKALDETEEQFGEKPEAVLADGLFNHGTNLGEMEDRGIDLYCPIKFTENNPAVREDVTEPVPSDEWDQLPTSKRDGEFVLDKQAFIYLEEDDIYYCPWGKKLSFKSTSSHKQSDGTIIERRRYQATKEDCQACPLKDRCLSGKKKKSRQLSRDPFDPHRERLAKRMQSDEGQRIYSQRAPVAERPFAVFKNVMGVRQFLLRGLSNVRTEWRWMATAFNLSKLITRWPSRAGPA